MFLWFLSIIVYFILPIWWIIIWFITWILLKYDIAVVHLFWNFNFAVLKIDFWIYSNYLEIFYFLILVFLIMYRKKEEKK
jgi:hypothetical protein